MAFSPWFEKDSFICVRVCTAIWFWYWRQELKGHGRSWGYRERQRKKPTVFFLNLLIFFFSFLFELKNLHLIYLPAHGFCLIVVCCVCCSFLTFLVRFEVDTISLSQSVTRSLVNFFFLSFTRRPCFFLFLFNYRNGVFFGWLLY